jgi:hypothetical protein
LRPELAKTAASFILVKENHPRAGWCYKVLDRLLTRK